jgi:hypothetical protein
LLSLVCQGVHTTVKLNSITLAKINIHDEEIVFSIVIIKCIEFFCTE